MKSVKDIISGRRFYYNDIANINIEDKWYKTPAYYGARKADWLHPTRMTPKTFERFNPNRFEEIRKLWEESWNLYQQHLKEMQETNG